jgi:opine dehydrogenase
MKVKTIMRIGFIGAGAVATALTAFLRMNQHHVVLSGSPGHLDAITSIRSNENRLNSTGLIAKTFEIEILAIEDLVRSTRTIFITTTANGHTEVIRRLTKFDLSSHTLVIVPENGFSAALRSQLQSNFLPKVIFGTTTAPYISRFLGEATVAILGIKEKIEIAASQQHLSNDAKVVISDLFPCQLEWYPNIASIFFGCTNAVVHPPALLWARDKIAAGAQLPFYGECVPAALGRILAIDAERLTIATELGVQSQAALAFSNGWYGNNAPDFKSFVQNLPAYGAISAPTTMNHRYLTEDVQCLLLLMRDIGRKLRVRTPAMDSIIAEVEVTLGMDLLATGVTLSSLGLQDASPMEVLAALNCAT